MAHLNAVLENNAEESQPVETVTHELQTDQNDVVNTLLRSRGWYSH